VLKQKVKAQYRTMMSIFLVLFKLSSNA